MPEIIIGPPGTGKTTRLLGMVEEELSRGTAPEQIGYVSFTRKAATEARDRARERFGLEKERFPWFRTLHSLCFRALGMTNADVMEGRKLQEFGDWIGIPISARRGGGWEEGSSFGFERGDRILFMENLARVRSVPLRDQYDLDCDDLSWHEVERVGRALAEWKKKHSMYDYTDMLKIFVEQAWTPPLEVLFVDEAQDLSMLQWHVVAKLALHCRRVVFAGDDDQAIYNWAGAAVEHFVDMPGDVRVLDRSWRVPRLVQAVADDVIRRVHHRRPKAWAPRDEEGEVRVVGLNEVDWSAPELLVLARNAMYLNDVRSRVHSSGYMYDMQGHPSIKDSTRQKLLTWERLRRGEPQRVEDVVRVYEEMSSGLGVKRGFKELRAFQKDAMVTIEQLQAEGGLMRTDVWHDALDRIPQVEREYIRACLRRREKMSESPRIRLSTIHGSKGGEAQEVVLITDMAPRTWREAVRLPDDEARVWYVAATRAKQRLTIVRPSTERHFTLSA